MKNISQQFKNDIHLIRNNQNETIRRINAAKTQNKANIERLHAYIVDWQIPQMAAQKHL